MACNFPSSKISASAQPCRLRPSGQAPYPQLAAAAGREGDTSRGCHPGQPPKMLASLPHKNGHAAATGQNVRFSFAKDPLPRQGSLFGLSKKAPIGRSSSQTSRLPAVGLLLAPPAWRCSRCSSAHTSQVRGIMIWRKGAAKVSVGNFGTHPVW